MMDERAVLLLVVSSFFSFLFFGPKSDVTVSRQKQLSNIYLFIVIMIKINSNINLI